MELKFCQKEEADDGERSNRTFMELKWFIHLTLFGVVMVLIVPLWN